MAINRPRIINTHCPVIIGDNELNIREARLTLDCSQRMNAIQSLAHLISSSSSGLDQSFDLTDIGPFKLNIKSDKDQKNILVLSIELDQNENPYTNLLNLFLDQSTDYYNKILQSTLLNQIAALLPSKDDLISCIKPKKLALDDVNPKIGTQYTELLNLIQKNQSLESAIPLELVSLKTNAKSAWAITSETIKDTIKRFEQNVYESITLKKTLAQQLYVFNQDGTIPGNIKDEINKLTESNINLTASNINTEVIDQFNTEDLKKKISADVVCSEKMKSFINSEINKTELIDYIYQYLNLSVLDSIISALKIANLFNDNNINQLYELCQKNSPEQLLPKLQSINSLIPKIHECGLLTQEIFDDMIKGKQFDYSSQGRLKGAGLEAVKSSPQQERWGYFSKIIENQLINMLENKKSLREIILYAASMRQKIAKAEAPHQCAMYGEFRTTRQEDFYRDINTFDTPSVLDPAIFPSILKIISLIPLSTNTETNSPKFNHESSSFFANNKVNYQYEWDNVSNHNIELPKETIIISVEKSKGIRGVSCVFEPISQEKIDRAMTELDAIYIKKLQQKPLANDVDLLSTLGELTFHLVRLYPFTRGTGAIVKWVTRSILQLHYGKELDAKLNDLRIGPDNNIPYDVYAHLIKTPEAYAKEFKTSLEPLLPKLASTISISNY